MSLYSINGDIDVGTGSLGESIYITGVTTNVSIVVGVAPLLLTKYYNTYTIQTESNITLTMPTTQVSLGWYTRIDMISNTGTGQIRILVGAVEIARLNGATVAQRNSVTLVLTAASTYSVLYAMPLFGAARSMAVLTQNGIIVRSSILANLFSYCDVAGGATIDANTLTITPLRWINPTGRFFDPVYYNIVSNTRITHLQGGVYKYSGIIGVNNTLLATQTNMRIRPRLNGATILDDYCVVAGTIRNFANGVYTFDAIFEVIAGDYIEIVIDKTLLSVGTNPVDLANTCMTVQLVGQN